MLAIRLPTDLERRLGALAERTGRTKTLLVREAIEKHLDDLEDLHLADEELAEVQAGRSKPIPLAKAMKNHGLNT